MPKYTGGEIILELLIQSGFEFVAGVPSDTCMGLLDAMIDRSSRLSFVECKEPVAAVYLADGYYRASGRPMAALVSSGAGVLNATAGIANAYADSAPVLIITGSPPSHFRGRGAAHDPVRDGNANLEETLRPITKGAWSVKNAGELASVLHRAFGAMMCGRRGPVVIDVPLDVQCDAASVDIQSMSHWLPAGRPYGDIDAISDAARMLLEARQPVILAGGGVHAAQAWTQLRNLAEFLGAPVVTTMMGKSAFPENNPLFGWHIGGFGTVCGNRLCKEADVILALGCRFNDRSTSSYRANVSLNIPPTSLIQVDIDPTEIGKYYPVEIGLEGDIATVISDILVVMQEQESQRNFEDSDYYRRLQRMRQEWQHEIARRRQNTAVPVTTSTLLSIMRETLSDEAVVVTSAGAAMLHLFQEVTFSHPGTFIAPGGLAGTGFALPAAIGAKLAVKGRQVVAVVGDADFLASMQELATAVQTNNAIVIILINNLGRGFLQAFQQKHYGDDRVFGAHFLDSQGRGYTPDYRTIALSFGCAAERISRPGEVRESLERALQANRPTLIEVLVNRTHPLFGPEGTGWVDVPVPAYLGERRKRYDEERDEQRLL